MSIGFNCALGANQLTPHLEVLSQKANFWVSAHPNAGLPNAFGEYDETPEQMADQIKEYLDKEPHQFITVKDFAIYSGIEEEIINKYLID